jgi:hypothetical protein
MVGKDVYCVHCTNWKGLTKEASCKVKDYFVRKGVFKRELNSENSLSAYGFPSSLNENYSCKYYTDVGFFVKLSRNFFFGIPLFPTDEKIKNLEKISD